MSEVDFRSAEQEYWFHVSPQEALPLAGAVEIDLDLHRVGRFFQIVANSSGTELRSTVARNLIDEPALFGDIRQFLGISDKRAYLDLSYISSRLEHPQGNSSLCGCQKWTLARHPLSFFIRLLQGSRGRDVQIEVSLMMADYLLKHGLESSASGFGSMSELVLEMLYARLISPKEYQQRAAKRRGHGCEAALASSLAAIGVRLTPADKATNPMGARDPNVDLRTMRIAGRTAGETYSFDMVICNGEHVRVLVQSLIHTSDPGQYGVNKSDETVAVIRAVNHWTERNSLFPVELWALLDGVGFSENKPDTINKLLANADYFIQLRTLYKAPLRAHALGIATVKAVAFSPSYTETQVRQLTELYVPIDVPVVSSEFFDDGLLGVPAGDAVIYVERGAGDYIIPPVHTPLVS